MQAIITMNNLPAADGDSVHHLVEEVGVNGNLLSISGRKMQCVLLPPLDAVYQAKGPTTGIRGIGETNAITDFVADERLRVVEQHRHQHFVPVYACRHRAIVFIHILDDNEIFIEMQPI